MRDQEYQQSTERIKREPTNHCLRKKKTRENQNSDSGKYSENVSETFQKLFFLREELSQIQRNSLKVVKMLSINKTYVKFKYCIRFLCLKNNHI